MTAEALIDKLVACIETVDGLRPAAPLDSQWLPWDRARDAVDVGSESIEIRVVATALPLPPLLRQLTELVREVLEQTDRADIPLRVVVTDLDAGAFREADTGNRTVT
ncbi:hypothetical protein NDR87_20565 [Nocardia sp. CDC159]|uniref:Uncharacterized protein n=1 Tax=Nocardia pulmonis TaxID=2951408 RepID=A0A9X2EBC6_9NOCA|nr:MULTISPECIES: hypothetical protein [Nocardia]MCM6776340.1 hypothetical protein [Nocardia pulmonis]MCM6788764.1 hypothetical protein [Nocardia sp. CDC159]